MKETSGSSLVFHWPGNFHMPQAQPKKTNKHKKHGLMLNESIYTNSRKCKIIVSANDRKSIIGWGKKREDCTGTGENFL